MFWWSFHESQNFGHPFPMAEIDRMVKQLEEYQVETKGKRKWKKGLSLRKELEMAEEENATLRASSRNLSYQPTSNWNTSQSPIKHLLYINSIKTIRLIQQSVIHLKSFEYSIESRARKGPALHLRYEAEL